MAIGETFLSAFLQVLFEKMLSPGVNTFMKLLKGGKIQRKTIKQWKKQLRMTEAALSDAEQKQLDSNNDGLKSWMQDLQDLAYDLEDVLDAFATQAQIYELMIKEDVLGHVLKNNDPNFSCSPNSNMVCQVSTVYKVAWLSFLASIYAIRLQ